jgi:hypothetical protein
MPVNTSGAGTSTIDQLILDAFKQATLLPIEYGIGFDTRWAAMAGHGRRVLDRILAAASTERFFEYFVDLDVLDLTAGEHQYTIDSDVLNIIDDGSYIPASNGTEEEATTGETPVKPMSAYRWNQLSAKSSSGTPVHYFIERNEQALAGSLVMRLWPVPSEAGKIRFRTHRIPRSSLVGSNNADFKRHWEHWAVLAMAYEFSTSGSMPIDDRQMLRADRDVAFEKLKNYDTENTPPDVVFAHTTPWTGQWR